MDRLSSRSKFLVQCVLDKNKLESVLNDENHLAIRNARKDLFVNEIPRELVSTSDNAVSIINDKSVFKNIGSITHLTTSNEPIVQRPQSPVDVYPDANGTPVTVNDVCLVTELQLKNRSLLHNEQPKNSSCLVDYSDSDETNMDYSSNDSVEDPNYLPVSDSSDNGKENCLTRWKKKRTEKWKVNITKNNRAACLPYQNKSKKCPAKRPKFIDCSRCRYNCSQNFSEEVREEICRSYWGLNDYGRQKDFIITHVQALTPKRRNTDNSRPRQVSKVYNLDNMNNKFRVCASFFEKTLCISNGPINTALCGRSDTGIFNKTDGRGRKTPGNKTSEDNIAYVKSHIESFPCVEAHYVRQSSKKMYLDPLLSIRKMYELYTEMCNQNNRIPVKEPIYRRIFSTEYNLSLHTPKKDLCATCSKYETADVHNKKEMEVEYSLHLIRKTECNQAKENDKERAKRDSNFKTITFDLQSVLQLPSSAVSTFYYLRKLCVYNLTIYDEDGDAICNVWNEINSKRGSNEIGTIIFKYILSLPENVTHLSMFSDTCGGQNRNQQMAAVLLFAVQQTHLQTIEQKFLESGHSHMECDSMHSAIENAKKNRDFLMMKDWVDVFKMARSKRNNMKNKPYKVNELKFDDFYDLHALSADLIKNKTHDTQGNKLTWLKIKCLKFEKAYPNMIFYRYDHSSEFKAIDVSPRSRRKSRQHTNSHMILKPAYNHPLPISVQKKKDLEKLCKDGLIPSELRTWYESLPVSLSMPDTDVVIFED